MGTMPWVHKTCVHGIVISAQDYPSQRSRKPIWEAKNPSLASDTKEGMDECYDLVALADSLERAGLPGSIYRDNPFILTGMHHCWRR